MKITFTMVIGFVINNISTACLLDVMAQGGQLVDADNVHRVHLDSEQL